MDIIKSVRSILQPSVKNFCASTTVALIWNGRDLSGSSGATKTVSPTELHPKRLDSIVQYADANERGAVFLLQRALLTGPLINILL
jgi:hypothetical protein